MSSQDREHVRLCLDGHPETFREIVKRYQASLLASLAGRLGNLERAEEVAQETFVRAYLGLGQLKKPESLFPWLLGIANRVVREQQRAEQRQRAAEAEKGALLCEAPKGPFRQKGPDFFCRPELSHDLALERAISELSEAYQEVVLLRYYGGLSCSEVAERLEIPLGTVTKRLSRAYKMLREILRQQGVEKISEVRP